MYILGMIILYLTNDSSEFVYRRELGAVIYVKGSNLL